MQRNQSLVEQLQQRSQQLQLDYSETGEPIEELRQELQISLQQRVSVETNLAAARNQLQTVDNSLRELENQRHQSEELIQSCRDRLEQARMAARECQVRLQGIEEQVAGTQFTLEELLTQLPEEAKIQEWSEELEKIGARIHRLGPINLAAIDEFARESERKDYLDKQHADLTEALNTLETAINKIDRETRTRFQETFDKVNRGVQELFPILFGGGHAYLELTDTDLLETGVTVMARPPGKRNSSIHLLSGGEKALTAVAFIFSLFKLNPAPFCLLDEVDAPLDDANVVRLCDMVKHMSDTIQFVFITHNKITMEISRQLIGVTMHEPGVSRLVSVDMDEAMELVKSA
jgi:chromosome segregation protein